MGPLRILIVNGKMICGGVESFIMNIYRQIDRTKVQFDFLVHYKERYFYDDEIEKLGGKIYRLSFRNDKNYFKYKRDLKCFFNEHKEYSIVWGHMDGLASVYLKVAKKCGVKITIAHAHITSAENSLKGLLKRILKRNVSKYADYKFACSTEAGKYLYGKNQFNIVPNAIDTAKFEFNKEIRNGIRKRYGWEDNIVLGHIGRFTEQKNHKFLLKIFNELSEKNDNFVLCLCGDGEKRKSIEELANILGLNDKIYFMGNISNVNEFYQAFDIFVMPSLYEGLPVSGIEAQTSGLKCIFSDTITKETNIVTENVSFLPITVSSKVWVDKILNNIEYERKTQSNLIKQAGFDLSDLALKLQEFLIKVTK